MSLEWAAFANEPELRDLTPDFGADASCDRGRYL